jgi:anti-anti-sigma factor
METAIEEVTPAFGVQGKSAGGVAALRAVGRLVVGVGAGHPAWLKVRQFDHASRVVIDLRGVTAIDAGGVGELVRLRQGAARVGIPVVIEAAGPRVRRVLQIARLDTVFGLVPRPVPTGAGVQGRLLCKCA